MSDYQFVTALADCTISADGRAMSVLYAYSMYCENECVGRGYFGRIEYTDLADNGEAIAICDPLIAHTPWEVTDGWYSLTGRSREVYAPSVDRGALGVHDEGMSFRVALEALERAQHAGECWLGEVA